MARIRSVKPEMRRSLVVSGWPYAVRWTFVGLPGYLDDEGRGHDDTRLIKAELYPLDDDMTSRKLNHHLAQIADTGPLCRYEVDGKRYLHITTWAEHQRVNRPTPSRIPPCPIHEKDVSAHGRLSEASSPHAQARVPAEQGRERSREQGAGSVSGAGDRPADESTGGALAHPAAVLGLLERTGPYVGAIRGQLAGHLDQFVGEGQPEPVLEAALREWQTRDRAAPGLLPGLVQDELRRTVGGTRPVTSARQTQTDRVLADAMARAEATEAGEPVPLRALPGGGR